MERESLLNEISREMKNRETEKPKDYWRHAAQVAGSLHCRLIVFPIETEISLRIFTFSLLVLRCACGSCQLRQVCQAARLETRFETRLASASPPSRGGVGCRLSRIPNLRLVYSQLPTSFSNYVAVLLSFRLTAILDAGTDAAYQSSTSFKSGCLHHVHRSVYLQRFLRRLFLPQAYECVPQVFFRRLQQWVPARFTIHAQLKHQDRTRTVADRYGTRWSDWPRNALQG